MTPDGRPHLPQQVPIDSYGNGGFRFGGMSHRGSLLCLPTGIWTWSVGPADPIAMDALAPVLAEAEAIDTLIVGTGNLPLPLAREARVALREAGIGCEVLTTGAAVRTYNILFGEARRVAAALVAVGEAG